MMKLVFDPTGLTEVVQNKAFQPPLEEATKVFESLGAAGDEARGIRPLGALAYRRFGCLPVSDPRVLRKLFEPEAAASPFDLSTALGEAKALSDISEQLQPELNALVISACLETETASASTSRTNGLSAFTYAMLETIKRSASGGRSAKAILDTSASILKTMGFRQTPLILERPFPGNLKLLPFLSMARKEFEPTKGFEEVPAGVAMEDMEKFAFLIPAITAAISAAPGLISALRGRRKGFGESDIAADMEKLLPGIIGSVLTTLPQITGQRPVWWPAQWARNPFAGLAGQKVFGNGDGAAEEIAPEEMQKFFPALLAAAIPAIVSSAPGIIDAIRGRRKAFGEPEPVTEEDVQKFFPALLGALLPTVLSAAPRIIGALRSRRKALGESEDIEKIFPAFFAAAIPSLLSAVPGIISAISAQRKELELGSIMSTNGAVSEDTEKIFSFLGPVLQRLGPVLVDVAGRAVGEALRGRQKEFDLGALTTDGAMTAEQEKIFSILRPFIRRLGPALVDAAGRAVGEALGGRQKGFDLGSIPTDGVTTADEKIFSLLGPVLQRLGPTLVDVASRAVGEALRGRQKDIDLGVTPTNGFQTADEKIFSLLGPVLQRLGPTLVDVAGRAVGEALRGRRKEVEGLSSLAAW
jgi:hypothetical protein